MAAQPKARAKPDVRAKPMTTDEYLAALSADERASLEVARIARNATSRKRA